MKLTAAQQAGLFYARKARRNSTLRDDKQSHAWGAISFSVNPSNGQTITLDGTTVTFGSGGGDVAIGTHLIDTLNDLLEFLDASVDAHIVLADYAVSNGVALLVQDRTPGRTTFTLAASNATVSHSTLQLQQSFQRVAL